MPCWTFFYSCLILDDETRWTYSVLQGLRLAIPIKMLARRVTRGDVLPDELTGAVTSPTNDQVNSL